MRDLRDLLDPTNLPELCAATRSMRPEDAQAVLPVLAAVEKALSLRANAVPDPPTVDAPAVGDRLLTPAEAATLLSVSVRWLYRHASQLEFTRRLSRKQLRFSEAGLRNYLARRRPCR
jgi:predicted DNA-binding transcriptional regulator AlpA